MVSQYAKPLLEHFYRKNHEPFRLHHPVGMHKVTSSRFGPVEVITLITSGKEVLVVRPIDPVPNIWNRLKAIIDRNIPENMDSNCCNYREQPV